MSDKKKYVSVLLIIILVQLSMGCARVQKVAVLETVSSQPYESMGILEVKAAAKKMSLASLGWSTLEVVTLSLAHTPSRAELYKSKLNAQLAEKADERYSADAVINPQYWPDLGAKQFPNGLIYARGEMIRYRKFES